METGIEIKNADSVVYFMTDGIRIRKMKRLPRPGLSIEVAGAVDTEKTVDMASSSKPTGLMPQLLEPPEQRKGPKADVKIEMCRNLSWNRAFFTNDGLLDAEELATITEAGGNDAIHQLQGIEEELCRSMDSISTLGSDATLEAKLFEEMQASTHKSSGSSKITNSSSKGSSGQGDSNAKANRLSQKGTKEAMAQASKVTGPRRGGPIALSPLGASTSVKTEPTRSSPLGAATSVTLPANNDKASARRRSTSSQTGKATADSSSKTPPGTRAKNKVLLSSNLSPKTSPTGSGSSSDVNQRPSRGSSGPRKSLANNEKPSATSARRKDEPRIGKTTSSIGIKNKPAPVNSHSSSSSSPLGLYNSSPSRSPASSISPRPSQSSSPSTSRADQSSIPRGNRGTTRSLNRDTSAKSTSKTHPTPDQRGKQAAAMRPQPGSVSRSPVQSTGRAIPSNKSGFIDAGRSYKSCLLTGLPEHDGTQTKTGSSKATKAAPSRTGAAAQTGLKPNSQKITTVAAVAAAAAKVSSKKRESIGKAKGVKTLVLTSPEVMDIKGKLHALKMELVNQKQENSKDMKMSPGGGGGKGGKSSSNVYINSSSFQTK
ncbi:hypothetical protein OSB04_026788 [Centaurea solstitialis]|uniref:Uncharacterized protein n=1 Tax=Centaurea solstitialis TaxID=347529 RepID=A0AA38SW25_9ASTR|nr:hypothetical protein OSB04_026788 [Centaurea solstitialis]